MARTLVLRATNVAGRVSYRLASWGPFDLNNRTGNVRFTVRDDRRNLGFVPQQGDYFHFTGTDGVTKLAAGRLNRVRTLNTPVGVTYECSGQDWNALLDGILVTDAESVTAGETDISAVRRFLDKYYAPIGTGIAHVLYSARSNMPAIVWPARSKSLRAVLEDVAAAAGSVRFYIDADKPLHWNNVLRLAPFAVGTDPNGTTRRKMWGIEDVTEGSGITARVKVKGAGGVEYEATDWPLWAKLNRRRADEAGAPAERFYQLPDLTDNTLTTVDQCAQRAFVELAKEGRDRTISFHVLDDGLSPGMWIDVFNKNRVLEDVWPRPLHRFPTYPASGGAPADYLGRFFIQRVTPKIIGGAVVEYGVVAGAYVPTLGALLQRAA